MVLTPKTKRKTWKSTANKLWRKKAAWIAGNGPIALLAHCNVLTVTLWPTLEEALGAKSTIDQFNCGGRCNRNHEIVDLAQLGYGPHR